jgi:hypothetical protein
LETSEIPEKIVDALEDTMTYVGETTVWVVVKKEVMKKLPPALRTNFSTRDPKTKKQSFNDFELTIVEWWFARTGRRLVISD